ncbi:LutB/LldF family L-lactate oxidation iron-sulfur protein [Paracidobacterium acidisoli]|uniref:Iron-sulfur cluster-binding protein n=1 Tax=Paracidobacterium acidisoli TaxID=2303751 RepID=A0A372IJS9_9BACT|nr:LutB/LldF family L-lactate oxidation iron-sulfur protein [Paracidobacterium acidisoli]MBT9332576.1 iron-sulfur cluster-binding protein [Paracidobacterium acidisoli]
MTVRVGESARALPFQKAALPLLDDAQLRKNVRHATDTIQRKRGLVVAEQTDWQELRTAASAIKRHTLKHLDTYLTQFEERFTAAGGVVHWASDADEANRIVLGLVQQYGGKEVIKIKTMTSDETRLNEALEQAGVHPYETDLAELIIQLGHDKPSHIVVPALHKNRAQIREIFLREMGLKELGNRPEDLTAAARRFLREKFLRVKIGVSGANFLIAETGGVCIVESEGNGRMCLTMPEVLISMAGIEKVIPSFEDLEVFLQLLPRSATGERMNPYNSIWTGTHEDDGPKHFHVVLLDNGRTSILADKESRQTLHCIRCAACLNTCPVYRQTGGHAYGSSYAGPIGAIFTPQVLNMEHAQSLPYASSLCGACYEVCPVKINIPEVLIHLRGRVVREQKSALDPEALGMKAMATVFGSRHRFEAAQRLARVGQWPVVSHGWVRHLPGMMGNWTAVRDMKAIPDQPFRAWWKQRQKKQEKQA